MTDCHAGAIMQRIASVLARFLPWPAFDIFRGLMEEFVNLGRFGFAFFADSLTNFSNLRLRGRGFSFRGSSRFGERGEFLNTFLNVHGFGVS
jgi:hypothetical protein